MNQDNFDNGVIVRFETPYARRRELRYFALFVTASISLIALIVSLAVAAGGLELPVPVALAVAAVATSITAAVVSKLCRAMLRFCVIFLPDRVRFGSGRTMREFAYGDVDTIYAIPGQLVKVRFGRKTAAVWLDRLQRPKCVAILGSLCLNAIVVDAKQHGHLPRNPTVVDKPLHAMEHYYTRKARRFAFLVVYLATIFAFLWLVVLDCWIGNNFLKIVFGETLFHVLVVTFLVACAGIAWRSWCIAKKVRRERAALSMPLDGCGDNGAPDE